MRFNTATDLLSVTFTSQLNIGLSAVMSTYFLFVAIVVVFIVTPVPAYRRNAAWLRRRAFSGFVGAAPQKHCAKMTAVNG